MTRQITIQNFLQLNNSVALIDVRTPAEFEHGHIPGAFNLPLFSNEERVVVGTTYKQVGREAAILSGFDFVGTKWAGLIRQALEIAPNKKIAVHCWRGGMRSGAMAWALDLYGFEVYLIQGGYKSYRRWAYRQFETDYKLMVLGGMTGSGKTKTLQQLKSMGEQIIDLEELAQHQGSSYGTMNRMVQPTQEQFENNFADCLKDMDISRRIWVEDESFTIGKRSIPNAFWQQICNSVLINMDVDKEQRISSLVAEYGSLDKDFLVECTERIRKRLGPEQTKHAIEAIKEDRMADFIRLVLVYYDKTYHTGMLKRSSEKIFSVKLSNKDATDNAKQILNSIAQIPVQDKA